MHNEDAAKYKNWLQKNFTAARRRPSVTKFLFVFSKYKFYFNLKYCCLIVAFLFTHAKPVCCQIPDFSKVPNLYKNDSAGITRLINNGEKISSGKAVCWFPKDSLSEEQMTAITAMIDKGISAAEKFINAPLPWQGHAINEPYTFYFRFDSIISHASAAGFVSISFWRIKSGKAPWLHEALHEMLDTNTGSWFSPSVSEDEANKEMPLWLFEGLPDYISAKVSQQENLPWFDVFSRSSRTNIDSIFMEDMKSDKASYILSFIGKKGILPELDSKDRILYAPAFYHGSSSFVGYIADKYGIEILLNAISSFGKEQEKIEEVTGKQIDILKREWIDKMGIAK